MAAPALAQADQPEAPILVKGWSSPEQEYTESVAWGDVDGDGDLDLFAGNRGRNRLYLNQGGRLETAPEAVFSDPNEEATASVAWGDVDGDGDLDLYIGNHGRNRLYVNQGGLLAEANEEIFTDRHGDWTNSVTWGDVDGDGDLDLFAGNDGSNRLYLNASSQLIEADPEIFTDTHQLGTQSVVWGDVDSDGDLDLFVGNGKSYADGLFVGNGEGASDQLFINQGGRLIEGKADVFVDSYQDNTTSAAWGDADSDGDIDLIIGYYGIVSLGDPCRPGIIGEPIEIHCERKLEYKVKFRLYVNLDGRLTTTDTASFTDTYQVDSTNSVAWGDVDGDGDLDLFAGSEGANRLFFNYGGTFAAAPDAIFKNPYGDNTNSVAWGDVDGDGDLDLFAGNPDSNRLYLNVSPRLIEADPEVFTDTHQYETQSVAWGDVDNDGDLDLFVGNGAFYGEGSSNQLYINLGDRLIEASTDVFADIYSDSTDAVAWGDADSDGDIDLFVGNMWFNRLYLNQGGRLTEASSKKLNPQDDYGALSVAWGDVDDDDDLDLVTGSEIWNRLYLNQNGQLTKDDDQDIFSKVELMASTNVVAWGDVDNDGDLDLFAGESDRARLFLNQNGRLTEASIDMFTDPSYDYLSSVAWGDVDDDGDIDLIVGERGSNRLYLNTGSRLTVAEPNIFTDLDEDITTSVAWGDIDGDGDVDLFVGNDGSNRLYLNQNGRLVKANSDTFAESAQGRTTSLAWGDADGDGDLDLFVGNNGRNQLFVNQRNQFTDATIQIYGKLANAEPDGFVQLAPADFYAAANVRVGIVPIKYTLLDPYARPMDVGLASYSLNGGGDWHSAVPTSSMTTNFSTLAHQTYSDYHTQPLSDTAMLSATITVTRAEAIVDLDVWLNLTHTHASDLEIALVSPAGTEIQLIAAAESARGFVETLLDDQAPAPLSHGQAPFTGRFQPVGHLFDLDGESTQGEWTLRITDGQPGNTGTLLGWALQFNRTTPTEYTGTLSTPPQGRVVTATIMVSTTSPIIDLDVLVNISRTLDHPVIELVSPEDTTVKLIDIKGITRLTNTRLSDQAVHVVQDDASPHMGIYRPVDRLTQFDGKNPQGEWTLRISGVPSDGDGSLIGEWTLLLQDADGGQHVYYWDVNASGFFGQSDNVVFRIEAYPGQGAIRNGIPGPFQRPFVSTQTFPFRVRGNQVQVFSDTVSISNTVAGAVVYRLPAGQERGALPLGAMDAPYRTADNGFLQGRAEMSVTSDAARSDRLVAVLPMAAITDSVPTRTYLSQDNFPIALAPVTATTGSTIRSQLVISDARRIGDIGLWVVISPTLSEKATLNLIAPRHGPTEIAIEKNLPNGHSNVVFQSAPEDAMAFCPEDSAAVCNVNVVGLTTLHGTLADGAWTLEMENPTAEPVELLNWGLLLQLSPLHLTSAMPTVSGLESAAVITGGVQPLVVSATNPLLLFDLNVALEWDASNNEHHMAQLSADLRRTSELLYDWTNGQAALGNVRVYHDARRNTLPDGTNAWNNAHVRIYATNRLRPNADQGGIVSQELTETVTISGVAREILYLPGQVRMGATWNRLGDATAGNLGDDWPAALAHELGHYLLFLDDNYLSLTEDNLLVPLNDEACPGAMNNPYSNVYSEFYPAQGWADPKCKDTLSEQNTGRSDWETIARFYSWIITPTTGITGVLAGPSLLPLAVTQVAYVDSDPASDRLAWLAQIFSRTDIPLEYLVAATCTPGAMSWSSRANPGAIGSRTPSFDCPQTPVTSTSPLQVPIFYIKLADPPDADPTDSYRASKEARAILFQGEPYASLVDLGQPIGDQLLALGARPLDRICIFEPDVNRAGCKNIVPGDDQILVSSAAGWEPQIIVSPETSRTLLINLELPLTSTNQKLMPLLRIYPANAPALPPVPMTGFTTTDNAVVYSVTISTDEPILEGYVWVGAPDPELAAVTPDLYLGPRQAIAEFAIGGNPVRIRALRASYDARGVRIRAMRVRIRALRAPVASTDGQVIVYPDDTLFDADTEWSFTLQPATRLPRQIEYATPIGRAYWLAASQNITDFGQSSITFEYLSSDVPPGEEAFIHMYFWDTVERRWLPVEKQEKYPAYNLISARLARPGLYALFSHIDIPLETGWNLIGYPVQGNRPISEALASIAGKYSMVFGFDPDATDGGWRTYIPGAGEVVNDLDNLQFGHGYWLYITDTMQITESPMLQLKGNAAATQPLTNTYATLMLDSPPAVYYGVVSGDVAGFTTPGDSKVIAMVSNKVCGTGEIDDAGNYAVKVVAHSAAAPGCGVPGSKITFKIGDAAVSAVPWRWDNQAPHRLDLLITPTPAAATDADYYRLLESAIM